MLKTPSIAALDIYGRIKAENWWNVTDRGKETYWGKKPVLAPFFPSKVSCERDGA
jgi:hypothetical protein